MNITQPLTHFLANDHPKLKCYMGETKFTALAHAYIAKHRSGNPNARWYSHHLADFLRANPAYSRKPELGELAELERALNEAFDSIDAAVVTMNELAALDPAQFGAMGFDISPSVRRFKVRTNVTSLWASLRCDELPPHPIMLDADQEILVWRQGSASRFRMLGAEEAMALDAAQDGISFAVICEMIAAMDAPDTAAVRAATFLRGWIETEIISRLRPRAAQDENSPDRSA
ncbi:MAG: HvfC/BufC family peptide modification chaperone [Aestuariivirga sp.]